MLRRHGVPIALSTDCNPGSSPCTSLLLMLNMACTCFRMTPEEALRAWGEFDRTLQEEHYPAVVTGYGGVAMIHGSQVGGMANDNVRGMPTFARMYLRN